MLRIHDLTFEYPHRRPVLRHVNATFRRGSLTLITGPSGTGKSTLLKLTARLLPLQHGTIRYGERPLDRIPKAQLSDHVAMMFQDPNRQFAMRTVKHELIFTLENRRVPAGRIPKRLDTILANNRLTALRDRELNTLSGGEKQRVALAIITALNSRVILLDEPFANVDRTARQRIMHRLVGLKHAGKIIVIVDHDLRGYRPITDQLLLLQDGRLTTASFNDFRQQLRPVKHRWQLPNDTETPGYRLKRFTVGYRRPLIQPTDLSFYAGHATLITGPNGSGKSTLFKALLKLIRYRGGVTYHGRPLAKIKRRPYYRHVNLTFQEASDQFLEITVKQELQLTLHHPVHRDYSRADLKKWLAVTGLEKHLDQVVYQLSGGQQKALQIIEALLNGAPVLLMDEPFQSLDHRLIRFFKGLLSTAVRRDHRTLIVISHQIAPIADLFDHHVQLANHHLSYQRGLNP